MNKGIVVVGELHQDLYYESDFYWQLVQKIVTNIINFIKFNPDAQKKIIAENRTLLEFSDKFENGDRYSGLVEVLKFGNLDFYLLFIIEEDEQNLGKTVEMLNKIESAKPQMENIILQLIQ